MPETKDETPIGAIEKHIRDACSWGAVYGEALTAEQWDQAREAKVVKLVEQVRAVLDAPPDELSAECMLILDENDLYAKEEPTNGAVAIYDCDGLFMFNVTIGIHGRDLAAMFRLHRRRFDEGQRYGREAAFAGLRALIGVDEAIDKATRSETA